MNKILAQSVNSMNYFFLREVFQKNKNSKEMSDELESSRILGDTRDNLYLRVIEELSVFLKEISDNELSEEIIGVLSTELEEGGYMEGLSFDTVKELFNDSIENILGYQDEVLLDKYLSIASRIYNK